MVPYNPIPLVVWRLCKVEESWWTNRVLRVYVSWLLGVHWGLGLGLGSGLLLKVNHSPVSSHVFSPLQPLCPISDPNPDPNPNQYPESYHNPNPITGRRLAQHFSLRSPGNNPIPNHNPTEQWNLFSRLAENWSRDHQKSSFSPIIPQGCIFTLRHVEWFGISVEKYFEAYPQ